MLVELAVRDLGVIEQLRLVLAPGMTAVTGETGAGKTLVVEALELLVGGRADPAAVRAGADEAFVEGRFTRQTDGTEGGDEVVLARAVPRQGRSRAYIDGRLATASALAEAAVGLVDLHGQHSHQSLLATGVQRSLLDRFAGVDLGPLAAARAEVARLDAALTALGGDERARAREIDLLRFQVEELATAQLGDAAEDEHLDLVEDELADAAAHREAAAAAVEALGGDGGALDVLGTAIAALAGRVPFEAVEARLRASAAELGDLVTEARAVGERIEEDPQRLAEVRARRQLLHDLRRKYGDTLRDVIAYAAEAETRLAELQQHDRRAAELDQARVVALEVVAREAAAVAAARKAAAPSLASAVEAHLHELAMARARLEVRVEGDGAADEVTFVIAANPGSDLLPLAKVASGGELARAMLALRLVLSAGPDSLVFDEVDAGIGGEAAVAVGRSLAGLAGERQVFVVTHLPQVAAFADSHVRVTKTVDGERTVSHAEVLDDAGRVVELSRMLSGQPDSTSAHAHASELLAGARAEETSR